MTIIKKLARSTLGLFLCSVLSTFAFAESETIHYLVIEGVEPLQVATEADALAGGLVTEVVQAVFAKSDYNLQPIVAPWLRLNKMRMSDQFDHWLVYGNPKIGDMNESFSTLPIFPWRHTLVVKKGQLNFDRLEDLNDQTLVLVHGYDYQGLDDHLVSKHPDSGTIKEFRAASVAAALRMLKNNRGSGYVDIDIRLMHHLKQLGFDQDEFEFYDFSDVIPAANIHLMFNNDLPTEIKHFINQRLESLQQSGTLEKLLLKYLN